MAEINLTEKHELRKFVQIDQFRHEVEKTKTKKGIIGFIVRLFKGREAYSNKPKDYNFEDVLQLDTGTEIPLRRSEWGEHRVMLVDQRVRVLEMIGVKARTKNKFEYLTLDMSIGYQVIDPELVARQSIDPLKLFSDYVQQVARDFVSQYEIDYLHEGRLVEELLKIDKYKVAGIALISAKVTINYPSDVLNLAKRIDEARNRARAVKEELERDHEVEELTTILEKNIDDLKLNRNAQSAIQKLKYERDENKVVFEIQKDITLENLMLDMQVERKKLEERSDQLDTTTVIRKKELGIDEIELRYRLFADSKERDHTRDEDTKDFHKLLELREAEVNKIQDMLASAGIPPQFAILASDDASFKNIRGFFQGILDADQNHKAKVMATITETLDKIMKNSRPEEAINIMVGRIDKIYGQLGKQASSMDVLMAALDNIEDEKQVPSGETKEFSDNQDVADDRASEDDVNFTVFYSKRLPVKEWANLLVYVHLPKCLDEITNDSKLFFRKAGIDVGENSIASSQIIERGAEITIIPELSGCVFNPPRQRIFWMEDLHHVGFRVQATNQSISDERGLPRIGRVAFYVGPLLIAEVPIWADVSEQSGHTPEPEVLDHQTTSVYKTIFVSYSHKDTEVVKRLSAAYKVLGMRYLRDVESLRSGERWDPALLKMINTADIFQLYWSTNAKVSKYVEQEWRYALSLKREKFIRPLYWEMPIPAPPEDLGDIHFSRLEI
jgi:hypothetical protein